MKKYYVINYTIIGEDIDDITFGIHSKKLFLTVEEAVDERTKLIEKIKTDNYIPFGYEVDNVQIEIEEGANFDIENADDIMVTWYDDENELIATAYYKIFEISENDENNNITA